jgi:hypothetical protein
LENIVLARTDYVRGKFLIKGLRTHSGGDHPEWVRNKIITKKRTSDFRFQKERGARAKHKSETKAREKKRDRERQKSSEAFKKRGSKK